MKITEKYLKQIIQEEFTRFLIENEENEEALLKAFVDIYQANKRSGNQSHRRYKVVDGPNTSQVLEDVLKSFDMDIYELSDALSNLEGKIDQNMFAELHDILNAKMMYADKTIDKSEFETDEDPYEYREDPYEDPEPQNPDYELRKKHLRVVKQ